jgi:hypothetical protein
MSRVPAHAARVVAAWPTQPEPHRRQPRARRLSVMSRVATRIASRVLHPVHRPRPEVRVEVRVEGALPAPKPPRPA